MRSLVPFVACVLLAASAGSGQDEDPVVIDGYVHEVVAPFLFGPGPQFGIYPVGGAGDTDASRVVFLTPASEDVDLTSFRGRRVSLSGTLLLTLEERPRLVVDEIVSCNSPEVDAWIVDQTLALNNRWFLDGTEQPLDGFDPVELRCPDGDLAGVVPVRISSPDVADGDNVIAYVCVETCRFWANLTGGIAGSNLWLGPFDIAGTSGGEPLFERAPTSVRPRRMRVRRRARTRRLTVRRDVDPADTATLRRERYVPSDFDVGAGIEVRRILRVTANRVRIRVRVARDADTGERAVRVLGRSGLATLTLRRR